MAKRGKRRRHGKIDGSQSKKPRSDDCLVTCHGEDVQVPEAYSVDCIRDTSFPLSNPWSVLEGRKKTEWKPTPIQLHSWSILIKTDINLVGIAPTGSGKTYAYGLPLLTKLDAHAPSIQGLILLPTRELAIQVQKDLKKSKDTCKVVTVYGGVDKSEQIEKLSNPKRPIIVAATPGRLLDLLKSKKIAAFDQLKWLVLDEADRLAMQVDMAQQVNEIITYVGSSPRMCLFSATSPVSSDQWIQWATPRHFRIDVNTVTVGKVDTPVSNETKKKTGGSADEGNNEGETGDDQKKEERKRGPVNMARIPENVKQILNVCSAHKKTKKLMTTLSKLPQQQRNRSLCLVFFGRIKTLQYVSKMLAKEGKFPARELHSHLSQKDREKIMYDFRSGKTQILLATDLAARGIHVPNVDCVINYDFPSSLEQYVHRCGRAGRSGQAATVYSFFTRELKPMADDVMKLLEETGSWVDPNLKELAGEAPQPSKRAKRKFAKDKALLSETQGTAAPNGGVGDEDDWEKEFAPSLKPNRTILKRASHVSDASSSSEEED